MSYLRRLNGALGGIQKATPDKISSYLSEISKEVAPSTRNKIRNTFSRFFNWCVLTKRMASNPVTGIKKVTERKGSDIVYCTPYEMEEIITISKESGWKEWIAVPIAFFSGLRREEIAVLKWEEIRIGIGTILVAKTKTATSRTLPLSSRLEEYLNSIPEDERVGYVVPIPEGFNRVSRLNTLMRKIRKMKKEKVLEENGLKIVSASKSSKYKEYKKRHAQFIEEKGSKLDEKIERIAWNSFRHTFGSLRAQAGVSLDKLCSWMGNSPDVCRRHYTQFVPRDRKDTDIDL